MRKDLGLLELDMTHPKNRVLHLAQYALDNGLLALHFFAFHPAILLLGNDEQKKYWIPKWDKVEIAGSYVQTELGHGSDVSSLQTTATYDASTKEFIMNTPSLEATKWYPGGLGKTSTHCVLYARLLSNGKDHGVNAFII